MALDRLTKVDGRGISTTSDYRVGIITASKFVGPIEGSITATDATFSGNVSIAGTLTYEDVTNIDSVGIITAQSDIHVGAGVSAVGVGTFGSLDISGDIDVDGHTNLDNVSIAGVTTFSDDVKFTGANYNVLWDKSDNSLKFDALAKIKLNDSFQFYHNTNGVLHNTSGTTYIYGSGSGAISLMAQAGSQNISCNPNTNTSLYYANSQKLYTVSDGVYINDNLGIQDSIKHILDTNTKIRFPAADTVTIETAGSERLRISSTGKVGINIDNNTGADLQVREGTNGAGVLRLGGSSGNGVGMDITYSNSGNTSTIFKQNYHSTNANALMQFDSGYFVFRTGTSPTERLRITSAGVVQIDQGTAGGNHFKIVNDEISLLQGVNGTGDTYAREAFIGCTRVDSGSYPFLRLAGQGGIKFCVDANSERVRITSNGNILIGKTADAGKGVEIYDSNNAALRVQNSHTGTGAGDGLLIETSFSDTLIWNYENSNTRFATNNIERLRIDADGRLQIASTNNSSTGTRLVVGSGNNMAATVLINTQDTDIKALQLSNWDGNTTSHKVMMGFDNSGHGAFDIGMDANSNDFVFQSSSGERLRIKADGILESTTSNNGQVIHSFKNTNTTAGSSAMTVEHWFRFNRTGGGMNASAARIIAGKEREWIGGASNQDGYFAVHTTADETSSEKMRISSGGIMTRPYQPAFSMQGVASPSDSTQGFTGILSNYMTITECNIGSHYKTSGTDVGKFVAPVNGNYFFSAGCLLRLRSGSNGSGELTFYKNGANISARSLGYSWVGSTNDHDNVTINAIISLAAGDKVHLQSHACSSDCDWYWGQGLGNFQGYLIG